MWYVASSVVRIETSSVCSSIYSTWLLLRVQNGSSNDNYHFKFNFLRKEEQERCSHLKDISRNWTWHFTNRCFLTSDLKKKKKKEKQILKDIWLYCYIFSSPCDRIKFSDKGTSENVWNWGERKEKRQIKWQKILKLIPDDSLFAPENFYLYFHFFVGFLL